MSFGNEIAHFQGFDQSLDDGAAGAGLLVQFFAVHVVVGFFEQGSHVRR